MATKTFKIGEYCKGGIITATVTGKIIQVQQKEWDFSTGSRRSSDQSNAKIICTGTVESTDPQVYRKLYQLLSDWTTSYYAEKVIEWIQTKAKFNKTYFW